MARAAVSWQEPNLLLLSGEVDFESVESARTQGEQLIDRSPASFAVDLSGLSSAHSVALSLLMRWYAYARQKGKALHIQGMPAKLFDVARVSGLETVLPLAEPDHHRA